MLRVLLILFVILPQTAQAADRPDSACLALAGAQAQILPARFGDEVSAGSVLIRYLDQASFAILTDDGTLAVTDYTG